MSKFRIFWMFFVFSCFADPLTTEAPILKHIESQLPCSGILKKSDSFVYLDIPDDYIFKLVSYIEPAGFEIPPYFKKASSVGAHISVINADEGAKLPVDKIEEIGERVYFIPKNCQIVYPPRWGGKDSAYILVVEAPELNEIREKYGLPAAKYDFHITIGVKYAEDSQRAVNF